MEFDILYWRLSGHPFYFVVIETFWFFQGILYKSAKKKKGMIVGFVSFETAEQKNTAVEVYILSSQHQCYIFINLHNFHFLHMQIRKILINL